MESVIQKLIFIAAHYAALALFMLACWGLGRLLFSRLGAPPRRDVWLEGALAVTVGIGLFIGVFQGLGIAGVFRAPWVLALVGVGAVAGVAQVPAGWRAWHAQPLGPVLQRGEQFALIVLVLIGLPTLLAPLAPPQAFDEVMYHLPYARQVARDGTLGIYEWLRYPWFPYNYNLLYAAGLMVYDDVFTHLLIALAGWLSVLMVYRMGLLYIDRLTACIGAGIWWAMGDYAASLIDVAVALFMLAACVALWWWREGSSGPVLRGDIRWLVLAAFFLGLAAGSKYQALTFLPLVALFVIQRERRLSVWALALFVFLIPCLYWYARNVIQTGDPFSPIGGRLFGFTYWNLDDYQRQINDVRAHAKPPHVLFWPVLLAPFTRAWRTNAMVRAAVVFCAYSIVVWALTSRYPRYMTASFPLIALMAALGWRELYAWIVEPMRVRWARLPAFAPGRAAPRVAAGLLLATLVAVSLQHTVRNARHISPTQEARDAFLRERIPGYEVLRYLRQHPLPGRLYLVALSDAIYYAPNPAWGDVFGPWRYVDFLLLPSAQMARKLQDHGFGSIAIHTAWPPEVVTKPDFDKYFELLYEKDGVRAYRLIPTSLSPDWQK